MRLGCAVRDMAPRPAKQQRIDSGADERGGGLQSIFDFKGTSNNAVAKILKRVLGEAPAKKTLVAGRRARFDTIVSNLSLDREGGGDPVDIPLAHPNLFLSRMAHESESLQEIIDASLASHPCSRECPWTLLVGFDEVVPGDKLNLANRRKGMNLIFSLQEFGTAFDCCPPRILRATCMRGGDHWIECVADSCKHDKAMRCLASRCGSHLWSS